MMKGIQTLYFICFLLLLISCSSTKYVGEGEYLLDKVEIVSDGKTYKNSDLKPYLRQQPNFKAFGLMKWQLFVYDWSGRNEKKWINKQLRRYGFGSECSSDGQRHSSCQTGVDTDAGSIY